MAGLSLRHIDKIYPNNVQAVFDFNLEIEDKEFIVLVGPSGCGKSTTLRMIAGLEEISAGELLIDGVYVNETLPKDRDIAMVFQDYALYPHMTVYDNMAFGLKLRHTPKDEIDRRIRDAAEILGITQYLSRKPRALSGGQRQRVALGRAIVREPKVFLLDEPLSNLDAKLRGQMRTEITKLHHRLATTFIYVTHDQVEAMTMGTRIVVMKDGYIQQVDSPQNLYDYPVNMFVAGFIGTPQMNMFEGEITFNKKTAKVKFGENAITLSSKVVERIPESQRFDRPIIMGVRPEDIHDDADKVAEFKNSLFRGKIDVVEKLGSETLVYIAIDGKENDIIARVNPHSTIAVDTEVDLAIDINHIQLFDPSTERNIFMEEYVAPQVEEVVDAPAEETVEG